MFIDKFPCDFGYLARVVREQIKIIYLCNDGKRHISLKDTAYEKLDAIKSTLKGFGLSLLIDYNKNELRFHHNGLNIYITAI